MSALNEIFAQIQNLPFEDQRALNSMLVASLNRQSKMKSMQQAAKFRIGDEVVFDARTKGIIKMEITGFSRDGSKLKGKQIGGISAGCLWTVAATLCNKA